MSRRSRRRLLNPDERALWDHVARSVQPLRPAPAPVPQPAPVVPAAPIEPAPEAPSPAPPAKPAGPRARRMPQLLAARPPSAPPPPPLAGLEPKVRRRLGRGAEVDARLDLHGLTQAAAHRRLRLFLIEAQTIGHTLVLVITGKGGRDPDSAGGWRAGLEGSRGVLRRQVPEWLTDADMRPYVIGFEEATRSHGGEGALYVRIRRRRSGP